MSHNIKIFAFPVLWALFIAFLELLSFDKFVHATLFFILVWSIYKAVNKTNAYKQALIYALSFSIPYGGVLEILQQELFDERTADLFDFIANTFGCIVASIYIVSKKKKRKKINVK